MVIPVERISKEGPGDTDDTTFSVGDPGESSHRPSSDMLSSTHTRSRSVPPPPIHSRFGSLAP